MITTCLVNITSHSWTWRRICIYNPFRQDSSQNMDSFWIQQHRERLCSDNIWRHYNLSLLSCWCIVWVGTEMKYIATFWGWPACLRDSFDLVTGTPREIQTTCNLGKNMPAYPGKFCSKWMGFPLQETLSFFQGLCFLPCQPADMLIFFKTNMEP